MLLDLDWASVWWREWWTLPDLSPVWHFNLVQWSKGHLEGLPTVPRPSEAIDIVQSFHFSRVVCKWRGHTRPGAKALFAISRAYGSEVAWGWVSQQRGEKGPSKKPWFMTWDSHSKSHIISPFGKELPPGELPSSLSTESQACSQGQPLLMYPIGEENPESKFLDWVRIGTCLPIGQWIPEKQE